MYTIVLLAMQTASPLPAQTITAPKTDEAFRLVPRTNDLETLSGVEAPVDVVLRWNAAALSAIKADRSAPPIAARNLAMMHVAMFDAVNAVDRRHHSFLVGVVAPPDTSAEAAAVVAAEGILTGLYPSQADKFKQLLEDCLARVPEGDAKKRGIGIGKYTSEKRWNGARAMALARKEHTRPSWAPAGGGRRRRNFRLRCCRPGRE